jgi:hypothetical protein
MKEILIIAGIITLVFSYQSFSNYLHCRNNQEAKTQKPQDLYENSGSIK